MIVGSRKDPMSPQSPSLEAVVDQRCLIEYRNGDLAIHVVEHAAGRNTERWPYFVGGSTYNARGFSWSDKEQFDRDIVRVYGRDAYSVLLEDPTLDFSKPSATPESTVVRDAAQRAYEALKEFLELEDREAKESQEADAETLWIGGQSNG